MTNSTHLAEDDKRLFELGSWVYPQPIAISCGRIVRSRSPESLVDAILKAAEILARYLATIGLASFASREEANGPLPICSELNGPLSFGTFLTIAQQAAKSDLNHPAKPYMQAGFQSKKPNNVEITTTDDALISLLNLRNELGHDLAHVTGPRAISLLADEHRKQHWREHSKVSGRFYNCHCLSVSNSSSRKEKLSASDCC